MRIDPSDLATFLAIARHRSFRAAATELGMSTSALSYAVAALEQRIGARLFSRTTRSVALSEAGEQFVAGVAPALTAIRGAMEQAGSHGKRPSGTLRINTTVGAAQHLMTPIILEYLRLYPEMKLDLVTESRLIDIVAEGFDAGIRLAEFLPQDMIAVPFGPRVRLLVVGAPDYFARHPPPRSPADLASHRCIRIRMGAGRLYRWEFERRGESFEVDVQGPLTLDQPSLMLEAARGGAGLAYIPEWEAAADLAAGRLRSVLEEWTPPFDGLCLYYPGRRHVPAGLRALIELIRARRDEGAAPPKTSTKRR